MKNNYRKMYRANKSIKNWLMKNGYNSIHLFPHTRFIKDVNLFDINFDGCCLSPKDEICFFQIKTNSKPSKLIHTKMQELNNMYKPHVKFMWFDYNNREINLYE